MPKVRKKEYKTVEVLNGRKAIKQAIKEYNKPIFRGDHAMTVRHGNRNVGVSFLFGKKVIRGRQRRVVISDQTRVWGE